MTITLRHSRREDAERLIAIWCRSVDATHHFLTPEDRDEIEVQVRHFLPDVPLWVAVSAADEPVAFMLLSGSHMDALFVDPDVRGSGVGRLLIEHALSLTSELTTDVNQQNEQAIGFYQKMGFVQTGRSATDDHSRPYPLLHLRYRG
ncbi:acetyltransferase [Enterobacteriaceae bacterium 89]|nr:acetyltransferase [Enterobacteriaceae bacterium 89]